MPAASVDTTCVSHSQPHFMGRLTGTIDSPRGYGAQSKKHCQTMQPTMAEEPRKRVLSASQVSGQPVHRTVELALRIVLRPLVSPEQRSPHGQYCYEAQLDHAH